MTAKFDHDRLESAYENGLSAEKRGDLAQAKINYEMCLTLDPEDHVGASVRLAALQLADTPERAPEAYVETLFDQHADAFDAILVDQLRYDVPELCRQAVDAVARRLSLDVPFARFLDLGCGTGLGGVAMEAICSEAIGIDLSERMVELAYERGVYGELYSGDAIAFLHEADEEPFDLVTALDVLPYLGSLEMFSAGLSRLTRPGSVLSFSTEIAKEDKGGFHVGPYRRFAHSAQYLSKLMQAHHWRIESRELITVRLEQGQPVEGELVVALRR